VQGVTSPSAAATRLARTRIRLRGGELAALRGSAARACVVLRALANEVRLMLVCQLAEGEKTVGQLQKSVGLSQSAVSQHLGLLRAHKLVSAHRNGKSVRYSLASGEAAAIIETLHDQFCHRSR
jgi:ArsR family transcriptional regulator, virulence genes transcriptional regulator